jgi:carboxymethylenebutenolidase
MAVHACNPITRNCSDPRNHMVYLARSDDGVVWLPLPGFEPYSGSVPDLIRRDNTLYVYTPGLLRRYRIDSGTWETPVQVRMQTATGATELFVDPSPTLDEQGRIVLFYLVAQRGGDPARCLAGQAQCTKSFRSATEVDGSDGATFTVDPGDRVAVTIGSNESASDPDVFQGPSSFVLYLSRGPSVQVFTSPTLRGEYRVAAGLPSGLLVSGLGGIPSGHYHSATRQFWTYVHGAAAPGVPMTRAVRRAVHSGLDRQLTGADFTTVISGQSFPGLGAGFHVESPGFTVNTLSSNVSARSTPTPATPSAPPIVRVRGVDPQWIAVEAPGGKTVRAAVAWPDGPGPFPVLVLLHGTAGFTEAVVQLAQDFARQGFIAVAGCWFEGDHNPGADPRGPIPCPGGPAFKGVTNPAMQDVRAVIEAAKRLEGARADRVALWGHSRGASMALLIASTSSDIRAVVSSGAACTSYGARHPGPPELLPIAYVQKLTAAVLLLHGTADATVPVQQARDCEAALRAEAKTVEAQYFEGAPHVLPYVYPTRDQALNRAADFLRQRVGP